MVLQYYRNRKQSGIILHPLTAWTILVREPLVRPYIFHTVPPPLDVNGISPTISVCLLKQIAANVFVPLPAG